MDFPIDISTLRDFDVFGFGTNAVDYLVTVPEYPKYDSKIRLTEYRQAAGGEVASTLVGLSRLGMRTVYAGRFGSDREGEYGMEALAAEGVDIELAERIEGARTQIAFIIIDQRTGERTVVWDRDARLSYTASEVPLGMASKARVFHFTPHDTAACEVLAQEAKESGTLVSVDIDNVFEGIQAVLPLVDVMVTSAEFPQKLFGISEPETALTELHARFGCALVGMTLGEAGSLLYCNGRFVRSPGFAAPGGCKDTTGAGDAFRAGLLHGILSGASVEESARTANAVAALKCREVGARTALPSVEEVRALLENGS